MGLKDTRSTTIYQTLAKEIVRRELQTNSIWMEYLNKIIQGDCLEVLKSLPDNSVDLIVTSPPYADQRKDVYGGVAKGGGGFMVMVFMEWVKKEDPEMEVDHKP